jgi:hypothetical protein
LDTVSDRRTDEGRKGLQDVTDERPQAFGGQGQFLFEADEQA